MVEAKDADGASQRYLKDLRLRLAQIATRLNGFKQALLAGLKARNRRSVLLDYFG
jgi:hypothetical protein